jgi:hypothetical protein
MPRREFKGQLFNGLEERQGNVKFVIVLVSQRVNASAPHRKLEGLSQNGTRRQIWNACGTIS